MRISDWSSDVCSSDLLQLQGVTALGATRPDAEVAANLNSRAFYSEMAGISLLANGTVTIDNRGSDVVSGQISPTVAIYPGTLHAASLSGDLIFTPDQTSTIPAAQLGRGSGRERVGQDG